MLKDYFNIYCILLPEKLFKLQYIIVNRCYDRSVLTDRYKTLADLSFIINTEDVHMLLKKGT